MIQYRKQTYTIEKRDTTVDILQILIFSLNAGILCVDKKMELMLFAKVT